MKRYKEKKKRDLRLPLKEKKKKVPCRKKGTGLYSNEEVKKRGKAEEVPPKKHCPEM